MTILFSKHPSLFPSPKYRDGSPMPVTNAERSAVVAPKARFNPRAAAGARIPCSWTFWRPGTHRVSQMPCISAPTKRRPARCNAYQVPNGSDGCWEGARAHRCRTKSQRVDGRYQRASTTDRIVNLQWGRCCGAGQRSTLCVPPCSGPQTRTGLLMRRQETTGPQAPQ